MKRDIILIIGCVFWSVFILAICIQCALGPDAPYDKYGTPDRSKAVIQVLP